MRNSGFRDEASEPSDDAEDPRHPLPRRQGRPRRQGGQFRQPARRRGSGRGAIAYDRAGADELCFLDITASHEGRGILLDVVRRTAEVCFMPLTVGGGVRRPEDMRDLLLAGADKVWINSAAVADREFVRRRRRNSAASASCSPSTPSGFDPATGRWEVFTHGGRRPTGMDAVDYAARSPNSAQERSCSPRWTVTARSSASTSN